MADRWSSGMWMVLTAVAIVLLAAPQARADEKVVANVPFDFVAGGVRMPAGRYVVAETEYPGVLLVQNSDGRHTAFILTIKAYANEAVAPELVFEHVGAEYYLRRVAAGDAEPRDIPLPRAMGERVAIALTHTGAAGGRGQ